MSDAGPTAPPPLEALLRLQDLDLAVTQLERRKASLPERRRLEEVDGQLSALSARSAALHDERAALAAQQAELEEQIAALSSRREVIERRMYDARGTAARDLQAMDEEVRHLATRRAEIEEVELQVMVDMEPLDEALSEIAAERAALTGDLGSLRAALTAAEAEVDAELSSVMAARIGAVADVPQDLQDRYETLRTRMGGVGAARLVGSRCSGCHLELPSMEVDRIRRLPPGAVVTCDQCGRILVPSTGDAGPRPAR